MAHVSAFKGFYDLKPMGFGGEAPPLARATREIAEKIKKNDWQFSKQLSYLSPRVKKVMQSILNGPKEYVKSSFINHDDSRDYLNLYVPQALRCLLLPEGSEKEKARRFYDFFNLGICQYANDFSLCFSVFAVDGHFLLLSDVSSLALTLKPHANLKEWYLEEEIYQVGINFYLNAIIEGSIGKSKSHEEFFRMFGENLFPFNVYKGGLYPNDSNKSIAEYSIRNYMLDLSTRFPVEQEDLDVVVNHNLSNVFTYAALDHIRNVNPTGTIHYKSNINKLESIRFAGLLFMPGLESFKDYLIEKINFHPRSVPEFIEIVKGKYEFDSDMFHYKIGLIIAKHFDLPSDVRKLIERHVQQNSPKPDSDVRLLKRRFASEKTTIGKI